ncbi:MAG TPA: cell division protein ZapA [Bacteroidia bacterium]|jgi:cell division protein ZapA|nr:cell division protein ZapA [Bacteroidia bacterium]
MGEKSVKITIAGRTYPIKIEAKEEAFAVEAAKRINEKVANLQSKFQVQDKQDLLAMTALQFATQYLEAKSKMLDDPDALVAQLNEVDSLLDAHLSASKA